MSGTFPPAGPVTLSRTIPAYVYQQYADDENIQALNAAYNRLAQEYVAWFSSIGLPIYTGALISGGLLDWVAEGLYGISRPTLPSGISQAIGPFNTYRYNQTIDYNQRKLFGSSNYYVTSDDIFKRVITWSFYKGDGKVFNIRWLKRRIMRFLIGDAGTAPNVNNTDQISVTFGQGNQVNINLLTGVRRVTAGALFNRLGFNARHPFDTVVTAFTQFNPLPNVAVFQAAVQAQVLPLPFQFTWIVTGCNVPPPLGLYDDAGVLGVEPGFGYPMNTTGLMPGAVYSNGGVVSVMPGITPDPLAPAVFFGQISATALLALGGGNLPFSGVTPGSKQLYNPGGLGEVWVA